MDLLLLDGVRKRLSWAADEHGVHHAKLFFDALDIPDQAKFGSLFECLARTGVVKNVFCQERVRPGLYLFTRGEHRLAWFERGHEVFIVHGWSNPTADFELDRANVLTAHQRRHRRMQRGGEAHG